MQVFRQFIPQFAALAASMAAPAIGWVTGRGRWHAACGMQQVALLAKRHKATI